MVRVMKRRQIGALVVATWALAACSQQGADSGATLACRTFRQVAADYETLTANELRDRLRDVDGNAQISEETGIATSARAMLVAATSGTEQELVAAVTSMNSACDNAEG